MSVSSSLTLTPSSGYIRSGPKTPAIDQKHLPKALPLPVPVPNQINRRQMTTATVPPPLQSNLSTPTRNNIGSSLEGRLNNDNFPDSSGLRGSGKPLHYFDNMPSLNGNSKLGSNLLPPRPQQPLQSAMYLPLSGTGPKPSDLYLKGIQPPSLGGENIVSYNSSNRGSRDAEMELDKLRRELFMKDDELRKIRSENEILRNENELLKTTRTSVTASGPNGLNKLVLDEYEDKLHILFQDMKVLDRRLSETSNTNSTLSKENEMLRGTLRNFEQSMMKMLAELRCYYEGKLKECEDRINEGSNEAVGLKAKIKGLSEELEGSRGELARTRQELDNGRKWAMDLSIKHFVTAVEFDRVTRLYQEKNNEFDELKRRFVDACAQFEGLKRSSEVTMRENLDRQRVSFDNQVKQMNEKIIEAEKNVSAIMTENKKLKAIIDELAEKEAELVRTKRIVDDLQRAQLELVGELERFKKANMTLEALKPKYDAERASLEAQILQVSSHCKELEQQMTGQFQEIQRLQATVKEKNREIEGLQGKMSEMERGTYQELEGLRSQLEAYKKANLNAREMSLKFGVEKGNFEREIAQYRQQMDSNTLEVAKLNDLMETLKNDNERMKEELDQTRQQLWTLNNAKSTMENERNKQNEAIAQLKQDLLVANNARDNYKAELERNGMELARKNQELQRKLHELEHVQVRLFDLGPATQAPMMGNPTEPAIPQMMNREQSSLGQMYPRDKRTKSIPRMPEYPTGNNDVTQSSGKFGSKYNFMREDVQTAQFGNYMNNSSNNNITGINSSLTKYSGSMGMYGGGHQREPTLTPFSAGYNYEEQM